MLKFQQQIRTDTRLLTHRNTIANAKIFVQRRPRKSANETGRRKTTDKMSVLVLDVALDPVRAAVKVFESCFGQTILAEECPFRIV